MPFTLPYSSLSMQLWSTLDATTVCRCVRGKVIGSVIIVVVGTKLPNLKKKKGIGQSALCHQTVECHEKLSYVCFKSLHAYQSHLPMLWAVSTAHARSQKGKGRRVIESISIPTRHYMALQLIQGTNLCVQVPQCYCNSNVAHGTWGMCSREL